jgi:serine/threonine protein kinase/tetratricopeptide (TPR) repeat protein
MKCPQCEAENPSGSRYCSRCAAPLLRPDELRALETETFAGPAPELMRGQLFAQRYEVIEELGSGGMGRVYKVFDNKIQDTIALKLIRPELAARPKTIDRFRDEIRLARKITHKNICRMHDLNEEHGIPYISMEYVQGEDLKSVIRMMGSLSPAQGVFIGKQVCDGLAEAHRLGIVHRDLKPRNIMIDREGNARIMDFGLARSLEEKGITGGRMMVGTAEYSSPEQVKGEPTDSRSDIYSLGVILFEMVTGRLPFEGDSALSIAVKHKTELPPDPRKFNLKVPQALADVILKCLEKDKEKRYQTAQELSAVLGEMEKEFPSEERALRPRKPTVLSGISRSWAARRAILPALLVLILATAVVFLWHPWSGPSPPLLPAGKPILAVLNFANSTGDRDLDVWRSGLVWDLIAELRRATAKLTVLSADAVATHLGSLGLEKTSSYTSKNIQDVASRTGASHVLTANFFKDSSHFWVTYQLKEMRAGTVVGSERVEAEEGQDFIRLVRDLSRKILLDLEVQAPAPRDEVPTQSSRAYKYYSLGREAERKWKESDRAENLEAAISWYEKAAQEDLGFALPYWGLGDIYQSLFVNKRLAKLSGEDEFKKTCEYYEKAYDLDPDSAGTNAGLGWAYFLRGDNDTAYRYYRRAFELEPSDPAINENIGSFYRSIGLPEQAAACYTRAINSGGWEKTTFRWRARCQERLGRAEEAVADARRSLDLDPNDWEAELFYARMLINQKRLVEAEREIAIAEEFGGQDEGTRVSIRFSRALLRAARGEKEEALALVEPAEENPVYYSYLLSRVYAAVGLKDGAIENINLGIEKGFQETLDYFYEYPFLSTNDFFDNLRDDPRFVEILERQKKKYEEYLSKYGKL